MRTLLLNVLHLIPFDARSRWWTAQLAAATQLFREIGVELRVAAVRQHQFRDGDGVISVGFCAPPLTEEHQALFDSVMEWPPGVVVFVVQAFEAGGWAGCARHPQGRPGLILTVGGPTARKWILAHELGHVLDLGDRTDSTLLMFGSTGWSRDPPGMLDTERATVLRSPVLV